MVVTRRHPVEDRRGDGDAERLAGVLLDHDLDRRAAPTELERDDGFVGEQLVVDHVAEYRPVQRQDLVADLNPGQFRRRRGRDALDLRKRHPPSVAGGLASLSAVEVDRVLLAEPRGFCAGVEMAIKALAWMVRVFEPPVYCYHEIVHNRLVVEEFSRQGVVFVDDVDEVPPGRRSCSPPTARRLRWSGPRRPTTAPS